MMSLKSNDKLKTSEKMWGKTEGLIVILKMPVFFFVF
jgi:hypothetical protein